MWSVNLSQKIFYIWNVKLTKKTDPNKYSYSGFGIGFDACGCFSLPDNSGIGKNIIIFGADKSPSVHADTKMKDILIFSKGPTDKLDDTKLFAEA